jgi:hypothetical protein
MIKSRRMRWAVRRGEVRNGYKIFIGNPERERPLGVALHLGVDSRIKLKSIFGKQGRRVLAYTSSSNGSEKKQLTRTGSIWDAPGLNSYQEDSWFSQDPPGEYRNRILQCAITAFSCQLHGAQSFSRS